MFWKRPDRSLARQLLAWLLAPLFALLLINAAFSNRVAVRAADQAFDRLLMASAYAIAEDVEYRDGAIVVDLPYAALQLLESNLQERIFYRVLAPSGVTLTGYDDLPLPPPSGEEPQETVQYTAAYRGDRIHLVALRKQLYGTALAGPVVVIVAETGEARDALSREILSEGLIRQALLIVAAGGLLWFALWRGLKPLRHLSRSLQARAPDDRSAIDAHAVQVEVRPLIDAINQHTSRIDALQESRQRLIADASHQMRTPLAEMRAELEVRIREDDAASALASLQSLLADVVRLGRLVDQLLLQARSDPEVLSDQRQSFLDLAALARQTALEHADAARKRGISLSFDAPKASIWVLGNADLLRELIANLLDNAVRYGYAGGSVGLQVSESEGKAELRVTDDGPGIASAERERVFERFYRGAHMQQIGSAAGSGLGLSIVRNIAIAHRAEVSLHDAMPTSGLCVRLRMSAAHPPDLAQAVPFAGSTG